MSQYDNRAWPIAARQPSWDQQAPPRQALQAASQPEDATAFSSQIDEVDRAIENLLKSGKMFMTPGRRDSMPIMGASRGYADFEPRMGNSVMARHHSVSEYEPLRPHPTSNLQSFYANQRLQPRPNEAEQMLHQKRRLAAQRERELRNYHQEQQYNRTLLAEMAAQGKTDRAMSPGSMTEDDRRELIARQHRALYARDRPTSAEDARFGRENATPRAALTGAAPSTSASTSNAVAVRGPSPLGRDHYGIPVVNQIMQPPTPMQGPSGADNATSSAPIESSGPSTAGPSSGQPPQRSRANSNSSPTSNPTNFSLFDGAATQQPHQQQQQHQQQSSRTSTSSGSGSPPHQNGKFSTGSGVAPIGTRPSVSGPVQGATSGLNKRSTTPLPSPLSYGFGPSDDGNANERSTSAASNPAAGAGQDQSVGLGWGNKGGVWGAKSSLGVQASVWG